jgi:hypothetical protein
MINALQQQLLPKSRHLQASTAVLSLAATDVDEEGIFKDVLNSGNNHFEGHACEEVFVIRTEVAH